MQSHSTRRFEMALPLFAGLDLGLLMEAQDQIKRGEFAGVSKFVATLGTTGSLKAIRKLAAIYTATDIELFKAETNPKLMEEMESTAADRPFKEAFSDAMAFHSALWESLGLTPASSGETDAARKKTKAKKEKTGDASPSEG